MRVLRKCCIDPDPACVRQHDYPCSFSQGGVLSSAAVTRYDSSGGESWSDYVSMIKHVQQLRAAGRPQAASGMAQVLVHAAQDADRCQMPLVGVHGEAHII